jgi:hypothetical protein
MDPFQSCDKPYANRVSGRYDDDFVLPADTDSHLECCSGINTWATSGWLDCSNAKIRQYTVVDDVRMDWKLLHAEPWTDLSVATVGRGS